MALAARHSMIRKLRAIKRRKRYDDKLRELILHIANSSEGDERFGATKLNKLLFYSDFLAYVYLGKAITKQEYQRLGEGPAPRRLLPVMEKMKNSEEIVIRSHQYCGYTQKRAVALREPDLSMFNAKEIALVDKLIRDFWPYTAREISEKSHHFLGWQHAKPGEGIPYTVALVGCRKPTTKELAHGKKLIPLAKKVLEQGC